MGPIAANGILHADAEIFGPNVRCLGESLAGRPVVVFGGGTVGLLTALFAQSAGAEIILAEPSAWRREKAEALGLTAMTETRHGNTPRHAGITVDRIAGPTSSSRPVRVLKACTTHYAR